MLGYNGCIGSFRAIRRAMNDVNISEVIVHGVAFDLKNSDRIQDIDLNDLYRAIPELFDLLEDREVPFALVGGIALLVYVDGRNTQDINLILNADDLAKLPELIIEERNDEFARAKFGELQVDVLFTTNALFETVQRQHLAMRQAGGREIACASVEGLLLLKLFALPSLYRQGNLDRVRLYENDVAQLLAKYETDMQPIHAELSHHVLESDLAEIKRIVADIQQRNAEATRRFGKSGNAD